MYPALPCCGCKSASAICCCCTVGARCIADTGATGINSLGPSGISSPTNPIPSVADAISFLASSVSVCLEPKFSALRKLGSVEKKSEICSVMLCGSVPVTIDPTFGPPTALENVLALLMNCPTGPSPPVAAVKAAFAKNDPSR